MDHDWWIASPMDSQIESFPPVTAITVNSSRDMPKNDLVDSIKGISISSRDRDKARWKFDPRFECNLTGMVRWANLEQVQVGALGLL